MKKPRLTPIEIALSRLASGHGAQRLPSALQKLEITNVPSRGMRKGQRDFFKTILPRIKYHNAQLQIVTDWHHLPDRKKKSKPIEEAKEDGSEEEKAISPPTLLDPLIRLHFEGLPSQELPIKDVSVTDITREMLRLIQSTTMSTSELRNESEEEKAENSADVVNDSIDSLGKDVSDTR